MKKHSFFVALAVAVCLAMPATAQWNLEPSKHVTVIKEKDRFGGWPANNGLWSWGDEIVVGFTWGYFDDDKRGGHPIKGPSTKMQARSVDGGETWTIEDPGFTDAEGTDLGEPTDCPGGIDFTHPDFAFKFDTGAPKFHYSMDRCKTWNGPFNFPKFERTGVLARTDYIVNGKNDLFVFLTAPKDNGSEGWPYCARTQDGGKTWQHVGWIGEQPPANSYGYAIMPSTVRLENGAFLSIIRRGGVFDGTKKWWIEAFLSPDDGMSWYMLEGSKIDNAGNPAAMIKLADGRIAMTYGWRHRPYGIRVKVSSDEGQTWSPERVLRHDGDSWDIGYPRTCQRADGKVVTIYYFKDDTSKERYIAATIWDPGQRPASDGPGSIQ
jgi:hypothetical protein